VEAIFHFTVQLALEKQQKHITQQLEAGSLKFKMYSAI
jgi:hypothetical protein